MRLLRRNLLLTYGAYAASIVAGLVTVPIIVGALGTTGYGIWAFIGSIVVVVSLLDLGVGPSVVRFAAHHRGSGSVEETSALASVGVVVYGVVALASLPLALGLAWLVPLAVRVPAELVWEARVATLLVVGTVIARFPLGLATSLLLGQQRFDVINVANIISAVAYVGLVAGLLTGDRGGLPLLAAIALGTTLLRLLLPLAWVPRELPGLRLRRALVTRRRVRELLGFSWDNFLIHIAAKVVFSADVVVVGVVLGATAAALYGIPAKLFALGFGVGTAATSLLYPAFAELEGREDEERQRALLLRGLRLGTGLMVVIALPLAVMPDLLITAWVGERFRDSAPVAALLGLALLLHQPLHVMTNYLVARGLQRTVARVSIAVVAANVALSLLLAWLVGIWGVALATVATETVAVALLVPRLVGTAAGIGWSELARAVARPVAPAAVLAVPLLVLVPRTWGLETLAELAPLGLAWGAACLFVVWRLGLGGEERASVRRSLVPERAPLAPSGMASADELS